MATINDVAKLAGVSPMSVSRVLNNVPGKVSEENRKKILKAIEALNYYPNIMGRGLTGARLNIVGIISPCMAGYGVLGLSYFRRIVRGIEVGCMKNGYDYLVNTVRPGQEFDYLNLYYRRLVDGLIVIDPEDQHPQLQKMLDEGIPAVIVAERCDKARAWIDTDNLEVMTQIVSYLKEQGHLNIGYVGGRKNHRNGQDRNKGYLDAMMAARLTIRPEWMFDGEFNEESGQAAGEKLAVMKTRPTAVVCANDLSAIGLMKTLAAKGIRIPEDISVTGIDGIEEGSAFTPALTSWQQPLEAMGEWACARLIDMLNGKGKEPFHEVMNMKNTGGKSVRKL